MARFDVYKLADDDGLVLDCQADLLSGLSTRLVVPLIKLEDHPKPMSGLNPVFDVEGERHVMATQFAATIKVRDLGSRIASLQAQDISISNAFDMLLTGY